MSAVMRPLRRVVAWLGRATATHRPPFRWPRPTGARRAAGGLLVAVSIAATGMTGAARRPAPLPATHTAIVTRARQVLDQALTARNPDSRKVAVQALGLIGPHEPYLGRLLAMTGDRDVPVRVAAIGSLVDLDDRRTLPALRHAYDDPVPEVSFAAAKALHAMGDPVGREALIDVVRGGDDAASGYVSTRGRSLARMFYTPRAIIPYLVARGIGMAHVAGLGAGVASLQGLMADQNISGRAAAALLLGQDPDARVLPALRAALHDKDAGVRAAAVHALALRDDAALEGDLLPLLDDRALEVRVRAAAACLRLELLGAPRDDGAPAKARAAPRGSPAAG